MDKTRIRGDRFSTSKRGQRENLCDINIREFTSTALPKSHQRLVIEEKMRGLSTAYFFGQWDFHDDGSITVIPDLEWVNTPERIQADSQKKSRNNKIQRKFQPRKCSKCNKHWSWYPSIDKYNKSRIVAKEYLLSNIFGRIPAVVEDCWNCEDV